MRRYRNNESELYLKLIVNLVEADPSKQANLEKGIKKGYVSPERAAAKELNDTQEVEGKVFYKKTEDIRTELKKTNQKIQLVANKLENVQVSMGIGEKTATEHGQSDIKTNISPSSGSI